MITKTEVNEVLRAVEPKAGAALDTTPVAITAGQLFVLVEAAKAAFYKGVTSFQVQSDSELAVEPPTDEDPEDDDVYDTPQNDD